MFFNKQETKTANPQYICILGASAIGLYLAHILQLFGHNVSIICSPTEADEMNATDIIIKNSHKLQNQRCNFKFCHEIPAHTQILIIASDITSIRRDLLLINPQNLIKTFILNLTPVFPFGFTSEILHHSVINGYFNGWITRHKNTVSLLSDNHYLDISASPNEDTETKQLLTLFPQERIDTKFSTNSSENFWKWLVPNALAFLFETAYDKPVSTLMKSAHIKQSADSCLKEFMNLASQNNITLNKNTVLNTIYSLNEHLYTDINEQKDLSRLHLEKIISLIFSGSSPDYRRHPCIYNLAQQIIKKL